MTIINATDSNFTTEVEQATGVILVDFWAPWCGPCQMLSPVLDQLASENQDIKVVKINIDESPETPTKLGVMSIPTLMLFKDGKVIDTKVGMQSKAALVEWVQGHQK